MLQQHHVGMYLNYNRLDLLFKTAKTLGPYLTMHCIARIIFIIATINACVVALQQYLSTSGESVLVATFGLQSVLASLTSLSYTSVSTTIPNRHESTSSFAPHEVDNERPKRRRDGAGGKNIEQHLQHMVKKITGLRDEEVSKQFYVRRWTCTMYRDYIHKFL